VSALTLTILQLAFLALLWVFVVAVVLVLRRDLSVRGRTPHAERAAPAPSPAAPRVAPAPAAPVPVGPVAAATASGSAVPLVDQQVTIGRADDNALVLTDDYVSSHHARLRLDGDGWLLEDLGSTNGVLLDGRRITAAVPLAPGAVFHIGASALALGD